MCPAFQQLFSCPDQNAKIKWLWKKIGEHDGLRDPSPAALPSSAALQAADIPDVKFVPTMEASKVIEALKAMLDRAKRAQKAMSVKTIDVSIGRLVAQVAVASNFWWLDTDSGGMLGKRRTYLLAGIHPITYQQVSAIGVHLLHAPAGGLDQNGRDAWLTPSNNAPRPVRTADTPWTTTTWSMLPKTFSRPQSTSSAFPLPVPRAMPSTGCRAAIAPTTPPRFPKRSCHDRTDQAL